MTRIFTKTFIVFLLCSFNYLLLQAQDHPTCDGMRYIENVFEDVESTRGLKFGSGTTIGGNFQELFLDVYEPSGDNAEMRPAIVLAFGGAYIGGERDDLSWLCEAYAAKGYVAVTIDYRIYDLPLFPFPTDVEMQEVVVKSISDIKAAIRFLREDAANDNQFRIDPDMIFSGGISAGSITAAHAAVIDDSDTIEENLLNLINENGGFDGNSSENTSYSSGVKAFVNFSGGLSDAEYIDSNDPTFISFHDEFDGTVPYGGGFANVFGVDIIYMEGSKIMNEVADAVGLENELHTIFGSTDHVGYLFNDEDAEFRVNQSATFLHNQICGNISSADHYTNESIKIFPNPTSSLVHVVSEDHISYKVELLNALGQVIHTVQESSEITIDVSHLETGKYFIKYIDQEGVKTGIRAIQIFK